MNNYMSERSESREERSDGDTVNGVVGAKRVVVVGGGQIVRVECERKCNCVYLIGFSDSKNKRWLDVIVLR